jgi:cell division protease FtsH
LILNCFSFFLQSTPELSTDIKIDCDFLPIVKEVLGQVPDVLAKQAALLDEWDRQQQQQQQQQQPNSQGAARTTFGGGLVSYRGSGSGSIGFATFVKPLMTDGAADSSSSGGGGSGGSSQVPPELQEAVAAALKLDDDTLVAVSRAIMGRLDIVDLVGKNTSHEVAERVGAFVHHMLVQH